MRSIVLLAVAAVASDNDDDDDDEKRDASLSTYGGIDDLAETLG